MMRLKEDYYGCILVRDTTFDFVRYAITQPYCGGSMPPVWKVQGSFTKATRRMPMPEDCLAELVVVPILMNSHFVTVCVVHLEEMMSNDEQRRSESFVVVLDSIADYFDSNKVAKMTVR